MPKQSQDSQKVFQVLEAFPNATQRMIADALGWHRKALDTARVNRAICELALEKKAAKVNGRWRIVGEKV